MLRQVVGSNRGRGRVKVREDREETKTSALSQTTSPRPTTSLFPSPQSATSHVFRCSIPQTDRQEPLPSWPRPNSGPKHGHSSRDRDAVSPHLSFPRLSSPRAPPYSLRTSLGPFRSTLLITFYFPSRLKSVKNIEKITNVSLTHDWVDFRTSLS